MQSAVGRKLPRGPRRGIGGLDGPTGRRVYQIGLACLAAIGALTSCATNPLQRFAFDGQEMGAPCRIVVYAQSAAEAEVGANAAFSRIEALNGALSDYDSDSELSQLPVVGMQAGHHPSDELFDVLRRSQELHAATAGAFDPTVGPLVRLWRRARRQRELPSAERLHSALASCGMQLVQLDTEQRTVRITRPQMQFDLGAIGKGYAADAALAVLRERGMQHALVDLGGDIALGAAPPGTDGWTVRAAPLGADDPTPLFLILSEVGIATSGDANRYTEIEGVRYSHIVDPRTGIGVTAGGGTTAVAADATTADALASALAVLGEDGIPMLLEAFPTAGFAIHHPDQPTVTAGAIRGF